MQTHSPASGVIKAQNHVLLAANQEYETSATALMIVWLGDHSKTKTARRPVIRAFSTEKPGLVSHFADFGNGFSSCASISVSPTAQISTRFTVGNCRADTHLKANRLSSFSKNARRKRTVGLVSWHESLSLGVRTGSVLTPHLVRRISHLDFHPTGAPHGSNECLPKSLPTK